MSNISYSAVILDDESAHRLKQEFGNHVPDGWVWIGHHMTIKMGELPPNLKKSIGKSVDIMVEQVGIDDRAMAVSVEDNGLSTNKIPHVTIAVNKKGGGKPFHSNQIPIDNWKTVANRIRLSGKIQEIPSK